MTFTHYAPVKFAGSAKAYFFGTTIDDLRIGEKVVAESIRGIQVGTIAAAPLSITNYKSPLDLAPIIRRADKEDLADYEDNLKRAKQALTSANEAIEDLKLAMHPIQAEFALDRSRLTITYVADARVDFRDLLHILASRFRCRIELRQIGSRDKARLIGGLGVCGMPLCCTTFLNTISGISINRAKNQLLALNIPKLSGQCDKLVCCLLYEDDNYTELKKTFPRLGTRFSMNGTDYRIVSYNLFSRQIKLEADGNISYAPLEDILPYLKKGENSEKAKPRGKH